MEGENMGDVCVCGASTKICGGKLRAGFYFDTGCNGWAWLCDRCGYCTNGHHNSLDARDNDEKIHPERCDVCVCSRCYKPAWQCGCHIEDMKKKKCPDCGAYGGKNGPYCICDYSFK